MITGSINLTALKNIVTTVNGKDKTPIEGIFIPLKANYLEKASNGSVYVNIVAWENKTPNEKSTHGIKQNFKKEIRDAMSKEESYALPFLGNLKVDDGSNQAPVVNTDASLDGVNMPTLASDDLPFN